MVLLGMSPASPPQQGPRGHRGWQPGTVRHRVEEGTRRWGWLLGCTEPALGSGVAILKYYFFFFLVFFWFIEIVSPHVDQAGLELIM